MNQIVNYTASENTFLNIFSEKHQLPISPKSSPDTELETLETNMRSAKLENEERKEQKREQEETYSDIKKQGGTHYLNF